MAAKELTVKENLQAIFLDWINNFISRERFAEYYGLTIEQANTLIELGREIHEGMVAEIKAAAQAATEHGESQQYLEP